MKQQWKSFRDLVTNTFRNRTVTVLGADGFLGRQIVTQLCETGVAPESIRAVDRTFRDQSEPVSRFQLDLSDAKTIGRFLLREKSDYLVNTIGIFGNVDFENLLRLNVGIFQGVCGQLLETNTLPLKLVTVGSAAEYGIPREVPVDESAPLEPVSLYGLSKSFQTVAAKYYFRNHGVPNVVARVFNIRGTGASEALSVGRWSRLIEMTPDGGEIVVGSLASQRDFLSVEQVAKQLIFLLIFGEPGEVYNVCSGEPILMRDLLTEMIRESGKTLRIREAVSPSQSQSVDMIYGDNSKLTDLWARHLLFDGTDL